MGRTCLHEVEYNEGWTMGRILQGPMVQGRGELKKTCDSRILFVEQFKDP